MVMPIRYIRSKLVINWFITAVTGRGFESLHLHQINLGNQINNLIFNKPTKNKVMKKSILLLAAVAMLSACTSTSTETTTSDSTAVDTAAVVDSTAVTADSTTAKIPVAKL